MNFLYKLEKKYGKYAINNLSIYVVGSWAIAYLLWMFAPKVYELFVFDVTYVFACHQYWRVITWVFTTPGSISALSLLMLFIYASIGSSIEKYVGAFLYNLYIFGSYIFITIGMLVQGAMDYLGNKDLYDYFAIELLADGYGKYYLEAMSNYGPTFFISMSVFLGFALIYSESHMLLFFVFPIKTKWLAYVDIIFMVYMLLEYGKTSLLAGIIIAVLFNFYLFYLISKNYSSRRMRNWQMGTDTLKKQKEFKKKMDQAQVEYNPPKGVTRHKCAICGRTEADDENLEFRFCSRCNGNHEYCNEHLFTHEHVK
ncbi:MAG: hypothetical protein IKJ73_02850 [Lachnospiraceae bacterium]|nr:hypothetical protein [Lachnospiraceae bacterium]